MACNPVGMPLAYVYHQFNHGQWPAVMRQTGLNRLNGIFPGVIKINLS